MLRGKGSDPQITKIFADGFYGFFSSVRFVKSADEFLIKMSPEKANAPEAEMASGAFVVGRESV